jgi:hypothetical protein
MDEEANKKIEVRVIEDSGLDLYKALGELAKLNKLVLCTEKEADMKPFMQGMIEHGNIDKKKIATFDPEATATATRKK